MKIKKSCIVFTLLPLLFLTGCWNSRELNTLAITICTGIDKSKNGYDVTQQVLNPKVLASKGADTESPVIIYTAKGKNIFECNRKMTTECPRKIYNSHLRLVVFGENAARNGIGHVLDFFARNYGFRTDFYFVIAKGTTANKVLNVLTPLESVPGMEMYDSLTASEDAWSPTKSIKIIELTNSILSDGKSAVMTGIETSPGAADSNSTDVLKTTNQVKKLKYTGIGVFKKDKLVGWLDETESKGYNYIIGNVISSVGYCNVNPEIRITYEVKSEKSIIKANIIHGKPVINAEISTIENIAATSGNLDLSKEENIKMVSRLSANKHKASCEAALKKAKKLKCDIFGFGELIHKAYPKVWQSLKSDWNNKFPKIKVNLTFKVNINQSGSLNQSLFLKDK